MYKEITQKHFDSLPEDLQKYILSVDTFEVLSKMYDQYAISQEDREHIGGITGRILMGLVPMKDFSRTLHATLTTEIETTQNLEQDIRTNIFNPVSHLITDRRDAFNATPAPSALAPRDIAEHVRNMYEGTTTLSSAMTNPSEAPHPELVTQLLERFRELTPEAQSAITSGEVRSTIEPTASTQQLTVEQTNYTENEIILALLGLSSPNELAQHIARTGDIPHEMAQTLANEARQQILGKHANITHSLRERTEAAEALRGLSNTSSQMNNDLSLNRDDILAEIENPQPTQPRQRPMSGTNTPHDRGYTDDSDPYREPIQ